MRAVQTKILPQPEKVMEEEGKKILKEREEREREKRVGGQGRQRRAGRWEADQTREGGCGSIKATRPSTTDTREGGREVPKYL